MWLDVLLVSVFVLSTAVGYRRGFVQTFLHTAGWLLSLVLSFAWYPKVAEFLREKTDYDDSIHQAIAKRIAEQSETATNSLFEELPSVISPIWDRAEETLISNLTEGLSGFVLQLISFLLVAFAIRLVFGLLSSLFSKKNHEGFIGFADGFLGLVAGSLKGIVLIYFILALMVPLIGLSSGDVLQSALEKSQLAKSLYDNNLLLLIWREGL